VKWGDEASMTPIEISSDPLDLDRGWVEVWERGVYLGLFDGMGKLEQYVRARPGRVFRIRFMQPRLLAPCHGIFPVCWLTARAGSRRVKYSGYTSNRRRRKGRNEPRT